MAQTTLYSPRAVPDDQSGALRAASALTGGEEAGYGQHTDGPSVGHVIALIRIHAASFDIDPTIPLAIARCESGFRWNARNPRSTASGVFQYLAGTWANTTEGKKGTSVFDADANIRMAITHIAVHGTAPWKSSKACWDPL